MIGKVFNFAYALNIIIQSAFSFLVPCGIFVGIAYLLNSFLSCPKWIFIPFTVIGVVSGVYSMFKYIILATKNLPKAEEKKNKKK